MKEWTVIVNGREITAKDFDTAYKQAIENMNATWQDMLKIDEDKKTITIVGGR